ncbi:ABC transporter ATP-binding protein [Thalassomonas actiniarum]|uniref:ABC transporter ATP-binding protein n=1 Tax=Thalassomonas actiniarum TaxID=485447 RepID=A0AAE9YM48_9GAMM|nr:ABC transporter ATP-binding protein [Thalassomonas actiniarum]WDD97820.1 ABC transporter ATP-binding protein [Thalassomonas actiniarum]
MSCLIKASALNKRFGEKQALADVNFEIHAGAPVALVGPNGAGKTTLFSILCGYIKPSSGQVSVLGVTPGKSETFGRLAALPQDAQLDPRFSVLHQLKFYARLQGFGRKESQYEAERTIDLVGMSASLHQKPDGLSHGMRKRVTIAQALIGSPEIVMLDEATAGLDPLHAREVRELVASLSGETTFILSSHDLSELERLCGQVLYLEQGKLKEHHTNSLQEQFRYFTLRMEQQVPELIEVLTSRDYVVEVLNSQDKEYQIKVSGESADLAPDIEILTLCHQKNWRYRQLVNGKTLENQLF